jgi:hypothetical protein
MVRVGGIIAAILLAGFVLFIITRAGVAKPPSTPAAGAEVSKIEVV